MRRRRRYQPPRCRNEACQAPVAFFRGAHNGHARPFDPKPFDRTGPEQRVAYPVENRTHWWRPRELVEDLVVRLGVSEADAEGQVNDMDWYVPHVCATGAQSIPSSHDLAEVTG